MQHIIVAVRGERSCVPFVLVTSDNITWSHMADPFGCLLSHDRVGWPPPDAIIIQQDSVVSSSWSFSLMMQLCSQDTNTYPGVKHHQMGSSSAGCEYRGSFWG